MAMKDANDPNHIHRKSRIRSDSAIGELVKKENRERVAG
jgi:hypothetical protein